MIYVVMEGKVVDFPDAVAGKPSRDGHVIHLIAKDGTIIGNVPMKMCRFWGEKLPPLWQKQYDSQIAWAALSEAEREALKAEARKKRLEDGP